MIGDILPKLTPISAYQPSNEVVELTSALKKEFMYGYEILHKDWEELNNYSVVERMNKDQRTFNSFVLEDVDDPKEKWKWVGTRSIARNKAMAMHAHLTTSFLLPTFFAQNERQEEDRDMSDMMRDMVEFISINSNYRSGFLLTTMGMLVNPVTYLGAEFCEMLQKIKTKTENGQLMTKYLIDEVMSGFQASVYSADQLLITNIYEQNIQKQRTIIERSYIEYEELKQKFRDHPNWEFVTAGIKSVYSPDDGLFYDVKDDDHPYLCELSIFKRRRDDLEVPYINGIYFGEENVEANPIKHRDNRNTPKYNKIPFGFERINEHFFYYKSLINKVGWDHLLIDAMYQVVMNREFLDLLTPIGFSGTDQVDTDIIFPGATIAFENPDARAYPLIPPKQTSGYVALREIERSISEASVSDVQMGQLPEKEQKAFSVARAEQNARIILRGVGRNLGESILQYGDLMKDIVLNHYSAPELEEITGNLKYRKFILEDQIVDGKKISKKIIFDESLIGREMSEKQKEEKALKLLNETKYPKNKEHIYLLNPHLFSKMKYLVRIEPDILVEKSEEFQQALALNTYRTFRNDPLVEPEAIVREALNSIYRGRADEFMIKQRIPEIMGQQPIPQKQTPLESQAEAKALSGAALGIV